MRPALLAFLLLMALPPGARAQEDPHRHHHHEQPAAAAAAPAPGPVPASAGQASAHDHGHGHDHDLGPAGATYDLRWLDAMTQHHTGALRMSELVFQSDQPGVGALATTIWREQAREIRAMGLWRRAWYPDAPVYPLALRPGGDPGSLAGLQRMDEATIAAMRMMGSPPSRERRVSWFLKGMLHHHNGALLMARDALRKSTNPSVRRLAREIIVTQRGEIITLRRMLQHDGSAMPE